MDLAVILTYRCNSKCSMCHIWWTRALCVATLAVAVVTRAATFYVDSSSGDDTWDGRSAGSAWRSLAKVNSTSLSPGDCVLFRRRGSWRGQLRPQSGTEGTPITYGAYGSGEKPVLLGSVNRGSAQDWLPEGGNIWVTGKPAPNGLEPALEFCQGKWDLHTEAGAEAQISTQPPGKPGDLPTQQITCARSGARPNHVQFSRSGLRIVQGESYVFSFRAWCSKPFRLCDVRMMRQASPWTRYTKDGATPILEVGTRSGEFRVSFHALVTADDARLNLFLGDVLPSEAVFEFQPLMFARVRDRRAADLAMDVGNILFDHGRMVGVKKWKTEDLKRPGDFFYDPSQRVVRVYSEGNPADLHRSIELALRRHIIDQNDCSHAVYKDLSLRYGAAHGIGGGGTHHIVVRGCDLAYIGGGQQMTLPDGRPVRYGNGIEFWGDAHDNLVENCRISEVYDAALTNQGERENVQSNITYRNNVIWNCEYSFEYWNREGSRTANIHFEHNTCFNAGFGWGHNQRPDPNGRHFMSYENSAITTNFHVRNNIFCNAADSCVWLENDWTPGLIMTHNCWYQRGPVLMRLAGQSWSPAQFQDYQRTTGLDAQSVMADPRFVNPGNHDFRLAKKSPARNFAEDGGAAGAAQRLAK